MIRATLSLPTLAVLLAACSSAPLKQALAGDTRAALERLYPGDTATGFDAGDLRGALWVEVPAAAR